MICLNIKNKEELFYNNPKKFWRLKITILTKKSAQFVDVFGVAQVLFTVSDASAIEADKPGLGYETYVGRRIFFEEFFFN
jgi:hypothetical protein